jgi:hypothetical protein
MVLGYMIHKGILPNLQQQKDLQVVEIIQTVQTFNRNRSLEKQIIAHVQFCDDFSKLDLEQLEMKELSSA